MQMGCLLPFPPPFPPLPPPAVPCPHKRRLSNPVRRDRMGFHKEEVDSLNHENDNIRSLSNARQTLSSPSPTPPADLSRAVDDIQYYRQALSDLERLRSLVQGSTLRRARISAGLSQRALADLSDTYQQRIQQLEQIGESARESTSPASPELAIRILSALHRRMAA